MKNEINKKNNDVVGLKKGMAHVFLSNLINLIVSLTSAFMLPKFLSIETYASIKLFRLYATYLGILHLGYSDGMYLRMGGKSINTINTDEARREFETFKTFQFFVCLFMVILSIIIGNTILLYCSLIILPHGVANYIRQFCTATGDFRKYAVYTNINTLMIFVINIVLLFIIKTDSSIYYIVSYIVLYFLYWILVETGARRLIGKTRLIARIDRHLFVENIKTGFFLMIGNFCNVIFTSIDRVFVQRLIGVFAFAQYSFAVGIENMVNVFVTPISTTMYNFFCRRNDCGSVRKVKRCVMVFSSMLALSFFPAKFVVEHWIPKYSESIPVLLMLLGAQFIAISVKAVHTNLYKAQKKQNQYFRRMVVVIALSVILNILAYLITKDMLFIAVATLVTNIVWFIIGEIGFKEYRLRAKDYLYYVLCFLSFLLCGMFLDTIFGCIAYCALMLMYIIIIERDVLRMLRKWAASFLVRRKIHKMESNKK